MRGSVLLLSLLVCAQISFTLCENLVQNPGFEDADAGWDFLPETNPDSALPHDGLSHARIGGSIAVHGIITQKLNLAKKVYAVVFWAYFEIEPNEEGSELILSFDGKVLRHFKSANNDFLPYNQYSKFVSGIGFPTAGVKTLSFDGYATTVYIKLDDVLVEEAIPCSAGLTAAGCMGCYEDDTTCIACVKGKELVGGTCIACTGTEVTDWVSSAPCEGCDTAHNYIANSQHSACRCPSLTIDLDGDNPDVGCVFDLSVYNDPIVTGFDGKQFEFKGVPFRVFNMLSIPDLQVSNYFVTGNHEGETYTGAVGVRQGGATAVLFDFAGAYYYSENSTTGVRSAAKYVSYPMKTPLVIENGGIITRPTMGELKVDWPLYSVLFKRMYERRVNEKAFEYIDTIIDLKITSLAKENVGGVLGQTYQHANSSIHYDGTWENYAAPAGVKDVFTDAFPAKYFKYDPEATIAHTVGASQKLGTHK